MFNRKSIYALNKKDPNAIVYTDADGNLIRLTCDDFTCAAEFRRWKDWSDSDLRKEENADHKQSDNSISLEVLSEEATAVVSIEDEYMEQISADEAAVLVRLLRQGLSSHLTETQRRRLWKYCVEGKPVRLIAKEESSFASDPVRNKAAYHPPTARWERECSSNRNTALSEQIRHKALQFLLLCILT